MLSERTLPNAWRVKYGDPAIDVHNVMSKFAEEPCTGHGEVLIREELHSALPFSGHISIPSTMHSSKKACTAWICSGFNVG